MVLIGLDLLSIVKCAKKLVMTIVNKYIKISRMSEAKLREYIIIHGFCVHVRLGYTDKKWESVREI